MLTKHSSGLGVSAVIHVKVSTQLKMAKPSPLSLVRYMLMKIIALILVMLIPTAVCAGGDYFPIIITKFESDGGEFKFTAKVSPERKWMDKSCNEITVAGYYDSVKWARYKAPMSKDNHKGAIEYLRKASSNSAQVNFGYIGFGLKQNSKCKYQSKGLILENKKIVCILPVHDSI